MSGGRNENDRRRKSHSVAIISDTGRGLAASRAGAVQLHDYAPARRLEWIASGQYIWTFQYPVSYGRPPESPETDAKMKVATDAGECKQYCGMPLLTDLAVMMRIDPLALIHRLREFVTVVYGPVKSFAFPDVQVKAYRNSVLFVNLVSVVDCSVLNWVEQRELRGLASDDRLFGKIAEPGWMLMDFNNHFKCRMGREDLSHIQFNPKLWNLRPVVKDSGAAMRVPLLPEAYAHANRTSKRGFPGPGRCRINALDTHR